MATTEVVDTSVTNNTLSEDYPHPDDHTRQTTDTPGFKSFINMTFVVLFIAVASQCQSYTQLTDATRRTSYATVSAVCDSGIETKWYRFTGSAGSKMPSSCVAKQRCNTHATGWLSDAHPTEAEGIVSRKVCYHWSTNCCNWSNMIRVANCGEYYIYELVKPSNCQLRYCGE